MRQVSIHCPAAGPDSPQIVQRIRGWSRANGFDITIYLMPNINMTVRASIEASNGHTISSDFPQIRVSSEGGQWGPKLVSAEGTLNSGGPVLKVRTTMGNIYIRRAQ